jgi:ketosteroid isomerase-like protein
MQLTHSTRRAHRVNRARDLILLLIFVAPAASAQTSRPDSVAALAVIEQFHAAMAAADSAKAVSLLSDDVMILESGAIQTRADYLGGHLGADMKASQASKAERSVVKVTIAGDAAYVVSRSLTPGTGAQGSTGSEMAELMVLSRTATGWKIRAVHWSSRRRRA